MILIKDPHDAILNMHKAGRFNNPHFADLRERLGDRALDVGVTKLQPLIHPSVPGEVLPSAEVPVVPKKVIRKKVNAEIG